MQFLGGMLAFGLFWREARRAGLAGRHLLAFVLVAFPVTLACSYGFRVWVRFLTYGWEYGWATLHFGVISFGLPVGLLLSGYLAATQRDLPPGKVLDLVILTLPLAQAVGRIGCFLNGCCFGLETDGPLGVYLPGDYDVWAYRYPTQLMLSAFDLALFGVLWFRREKVRYPGGQAFLYLFCFSIGRVLIDALRDLPRVFGPFSPHQLATLAILLVTGYLYFEWRLARRAGERREA